jgi:hypothetical protein
MVKISLCCLLLGLLIFNQSHAQVSYAVPVSIDQSQLCEQVVGLKDRFELFNIHPNPAGNFIQVSSLEAGNLHFYNTAGSTMLSIPISVGTSNIDVRNLKQGFYILRLDAANKHWHVRLIKE